MIKVSALRSIGRRAALVKAADEYSDLMNGYAASQGPLLRGAVQTSVNRNLRASGYDLSKVKPVAPKSPYYKGETVDMKKLTEDDMARMMAGARARVRGAVGSVAGAATQYARGAYSAARGAIAPLQQRIAAWKASRAKQQSPAGGAVLGTSTVSR